MDIAGFPGLGPFLDPLALTIVGGGTAVAVVLRTPLRDVGRGLSALRLLFRRGFDADPLVAQILSLTRIARRHGITRLDRAVIADPDVSATIAAIVDGGDPLGVFRHRQAARTERHRAAIEMWAGAADIAPSMGMVGTLIGLVQMFTSMRDPGAIGGAMAVALLTTLYGAVLATLVAMPVAARLQRQARREAEERARLERPLMALAALEPAVPREMMEAVA
ncbi:motility protein A [Sphingomonas canadensis]|uniref:Motility protein A n=1 Tax=Sphingomonas canadensis TaxID=1219257 RepID=A0ABW3H3H5_9SPHN|nr:MotA/TolQ/ExbB proton channel family protein [Sphingomonas canadensis]MCW3834840.1 MotA/TolQ/ExbB proton channel family protein [Sphingomonas canadensis]